MSPEHKQERSEGPSLRKSFLWLGGEGVPCDEMDGADGWKYAEAESRE